METLSGSWLRAHWGYFNRTKATLQHALGADNRVTGQVEGEPPTQFQPGFVLQAFNTVFDAGATSTWSIAGAAATADARAHACSPAERAASPSELVNPAPGSAMFLGANFWGLQWQPATEYFLPRANFAAERAAPWQPRFLDELAPYRVLRFMDWNLTNDAQNPQSQWSTRQPPGQAQGDAVAYEWQIDPTNILRSAGHPQRPSTRTAGTAVPLSDRVPRPTTQDGLCFAYAALQRVAEAYSHPAQQRNAWRAGRSWRGSCRLYSPLTSLLCPVVAAATFPSRSRQRRSRHPAPTPPSARA